MAFDAGSITSELRLDRSPFMRTLTAARGAAWEFAQNRFSPTLSATADPAIRHTARAREKVEDFGRQRESATLDVDDTQARNTLTEYERTIRNYTRSWSQRGIRTRITADIRRASRNLRTLESLKESATGDERLRVEAEITRAQERLQALQKLAVSVGAQSPTVSVGVRGAVASMATMLGLQTVADRLDGYNVRFGADIDSSLSKALPQALGAVEQQLLRFKTVSTAIAAVTVPVLYASYAMLPAVISTVGAAVGSLGIALGQGLAGGAGVAAVALGQGLVGGLSAVGGALGLGGIALAGYYSAVQRTVNYVGDLTNVLDNQIDAVEDAGKAVEEAQKRLKAAEKGTKEYTRAARGLALAKENERYEQQRLNTLYDIATPRILKLQKGTNRARIRLLEMGGAIMNEVAPALMTGLNQFDRFGDGIHRGAVGMTRDMTGVSRSLIDTATKGQNLRSITRILRGIRRAGPPALTAVGNAALAAVNFLAPLVPYSLGVLRNVSDLAVEARKWTQSAEGQREIAEIWETLVARGQQLGGIGSNISQIVYQGLAPAARYSGDFLGYLEGITGEGAKWANSAPGQRRIARVWGTLVDRGQWLWRVTKNLSPALWGVLDALDEAGLVDYMSGRVERLSGRFAGLMSDSGKGTRGVVEFGRDVKPVLRSAERLATDLGAGFFSLTDTVVNFRNETTGKRVMVEIIEAFRYMANELIPFLRHEFEEIGPLLPPLIRAVTDWFVVFARAQPEMKLFIRGVTGILEAFNSLDEKTRIQIARTSAWIFAIKALGGFKLLGLIGGLTIAVIKQGAMLWGYKKMSGHLTTLIGQQAALNKLIGSTVPGGRGRIPNTGKAMKPPVVPPPVPAKRFWRRIPKSAPPPVSPPVAPPPPARGYWRRVPRVAPPAASPPVPPPSPARGYWRRVPRVAPPAASPPVPPPSPARGYWRRVPRVAPPMAAPMVPAPVPQRRYWRKYPRVGPPIFAPTIPAPVPARGFWRKTPRRTPPVTTPPVPAPVPSRGFKGGFLRRLTQIGFLASVGGWFARMWRRIPFAAQLGNAFRKMKASRILGGILGAFKKVGWNFLIKFIGLRVIGGLLGFLLGPAGWILLAYSLIDMLTGGWLTKKLTPVGKWIGENIIGGIAKGIGWAWRHTLKPALSWIGRAAPDWLKRVLGIRSPSTVGEWIGKMFGISLPKGMRRAIPDMQRAAGEISRAGMPDMAEVSYKAPTVRGPGRPGQDSGGSSRQPRPPRQRWKKSQRPAVYMVVDGRVMGELVGEKLEEYLR